MRESQYFAILHGPAVLLKDWPGRGGKTSQCFTAREGIVSPDQRPFPGRCFAILRNASAVPPQYFFPFKGEVPANEAIEVDPPRCVATWGWQGGCGFGGGAKTKTARQLRPHVMGHNDHE